MDPFFGSIFIKRCFFNFKSGYNANTTNYQRIPLAFCSLYSRQIRGIRVIHL